MKSSCFRRRRNRPIVLLSLVLAFFLLSLAGCPLGSGDSVLRLWDAGPITLDPAIAADFSSYTYVVHIFSGLVRLDHELRTVPDIAESWE